jgi:hypothetical protein
MRSRTGSAAEPASVGAKNIRFIWDVINEGGNLEARCGAPRCQHHSVIDAQQLGRRVQINLWSTSLEALAMQLRCSKCGHRGGHFRMSCEPVTGPKVGPVDESEAKAWTRMRRG